MNSEQFRTRLCRISNIRASRAPQLFTIHYSLFTVHYSPISDIWKIDRMLRQSRYFWPFWLQNQTITPAIDITAFFCYNASQGVNHLETDRLTDRYRKDMKLWKNALPADLTTRTTMRSAAPAAVRIFPNRTAPMTLPRSLFRQSR